MGVLVDFNVREEVLQRSLILRRSLREKEN